MMAKRKRPARASQELDSSGGKLDVLNMQPIGAWPYPRIAVAPLLERSISYADKVFWPFISMAQQGAPFIKMGYGRTDLNRNKAATELLKSNYTHVLMLDIDHTHPEDIIQRLAKWCLMDDDIWIVGGLNFRRGAPFEPCVFFYDEDDKVYAPAEWGNGLLEVDVLGTGCILIDRRVFETIEPPWFTYDYDSALKDHWPGEDISFSRRCREAGIPLYCDTGVTSPHMIDGTVTETTFRAYMKHTQETIHTFRDGVKIGEEVAK
jgi:hypothetical protein